MKIRRVLLIVLIVLVIFCVAADPSKSKRKKKARSAPKPHIKPEAYQFKRKEYTEEELEKEWGDNEEEDNTWHENTWEWKEKMKKQKTSTGFDVNDPGSFLLANQDGKMDLNFVHLEKDLKLKKKEVEELCHRWETQMKLGGLVVNVKYVKDDLLLVNQDDGNIFHMKNFILSQPEVAKMNWHDHDFYPPGKSPEERKKAKLEAKKKLSQKEQETTAGTMGNEKGETNQNDDL